jgi:hypothetical protein
VSHLPVEAHLIAPRWLLTLMSPGPRLASRAKSEKKMMVAAIIKWPHVQKFKFHPHIVCDFYK